MTRRAKTTTTAVMTSGLAGLDPRALGQALEHKYLGHDHLLDLDGVHALVGRVDAGSRDVFRPPQHEFCSRRSLLESSQQGDGSSAARLARGPAEGLGQRLAGGGIPRAVGLAEEGGCFLGALDL